MNSNNRFVSALLLGILAAMSIIVIAGCDEYSGGSGLITGDTSSSQNPSQNGGTLAGRRDPPPTRGIVSSGGSDNIIPSKTTENGVTMGRQTLVSPVALELLPNGSIQLITPLPPTKGTLYVLVNISQWAPRPEDAMPFLTALYPMTIHINSSRSAPFVPEKWPGAFTQVIIEPLEVLQGASLPIASYERKVIPEGHDFVPYEPIEGQKEIVFPPQ